MSSPVRASTRVSLNWPQHGSGPSEDTDTLILTINNYCLDLRIFLEIHADAGKVDWSTVSMVENVAGSSVKKPVIRWHHLLDSRPPPPEPLTDEGHFETLSNKDVLETGVMYNPSSGKNEPYEETWRRLPVEEDAPYYVLETVDGSHDDDEPGGKGKGRGKVFIGRLGNRAMLLGRDGAGTWIARRWTLEEGTWRTVYNIGVTSESSPADLAAGNLRVGVEFEYRGSHWVIREVGTLSAPVIM